MKTTLALLIVSLLLPTLGIGQDTDLESPKAKAAVREYERTLEDVDKDYQKQLKDLEKSYQMKAELVRARLITNLNAALEEEARKINLEEANKIKAVVDEAKKYEVPTLGGLLDQPEKKPTKTVKAKVPKNAIKFNGHHYLWIKEPTTWHIAQDYAKSVGGHLARIESVKEMAFIANVGGSTPGIHLDGTDEKREGTWLFSNGEPIDPSVLVWLHGKGPRNLHAQHHLYFWGGTVCDAEAGTRVGFIIEWDK